MNELKVNHSVKISHNMLQIHGTIESELKKYDVVVTIDTVAETKKLMADLNKQKLEFTKRCNAYLSDIEDPIKQFKIDKKTIENLFVDARLRLSTQVESFESVRLDDISTIVIEFKNKLCVEKGIDIASVSVEDLIKLTVVTSTGKITKATNDTIINRVDDVIKEKERLENIAKIEKLEQDQRDEKIRQQAIEDGRLKGIAEAEAKQKRIEKEAEKTTISEMEIVDNNVQINTKTTPEQTQTSCQDPIIEHNAHNKKVFENKTHKVLVEITIENVPSHIPDQAVKNKVNNTLIGFGLTSFKVL